MLNTTEQIEIVTVDHRERWNEIVKGFFGWDIYYLWEYVYSLFIHGDGTPKLIYYSVGENKIAYVVMESDIAEMDCFCELLERGKRFDWATPYGYGGPLIAGTPSKQWMEDFRRKMNDICSDNGVVTTFFRFHPLLQNQCYVENVFDVRYLKKTVYMDTSDTETIFRNMTPNSRNMIRKAEKNGVRIIHDRGQRIEDFIQVYEATMTNRNAQDYYYFEREYFDFLLQNFADHMTVFYAVYGEQIVSASIFFYNERYMHYHLSGTLPQFRNLAATNLLLYEAAKWAAGQKIRRFHLGGGVANEDSLLSFKKHFNRNGLLDFCIGRQIHMPGEYEKLLRLRAENDKNFHADNHFMIQYRGEN